MKWELGRQGTGYLKRKLAEGKWWDVWLLKYPIGTQIPAHRDPVPGARHYRLNIVLRGEDSYRGAAIVRLPRIVLFRPDVTTHSVSEVRRERLVLSLGWIVKERPWKSRTSHS